MNTKNFFEKLQEESDYNFELETEGMKKPTVFMNLIYLKTNEMNKEEYEEYENFCESNSILKDKYEIIISYDVSGFEYWNDSGNGENYIGLMIILKENNYTLEDLKELINDLTELIDYKISDFDYYTPYGVLEYLL